MRVRVLYFGVLKETCEREREELDLAECASVADFLSFYRERYPGQERLWSSIAVAVNQEYARLDLVLRDGDEVALLPPVSGGCTA